MSRRIQLVLGLLAAALVAGLAWLWHDNMELRWLTLPRSSQAAIENRMLGATMLLRQRGTTVSLAGSLGALNLRTLPDGTLIIGNEDGITAPETAQLLLAWVRRGNTLITSPRRVLPAERASLTASQAPTTNDEDGDDDEEEGTKPVVVTLPVRKAEARRPRLTPPAALVETDPLAARYGVRRRGSSALRQCSEEHEKATAGTTHKHTNCVPAKQYKAPEYRLDLPGAAYPLRLDEGNGVLASMPGAMAPLWADEKAEALRVYGEGKGRVVLTAGNYFSNADLRNFDHAELLLALTGLNGARNVTLVKSFDMLRWYQALWRHFHDVLIALTVCAALLLWMAVRRFGPRLPQSAPERRSLMEHISASGAWLWKAEGGRQLLLEAAREETLSLLRRRAPGLFRLPSQALPGALASASGIDPEHLAQALHDDAARQPTRFTRQIRTLQELRNHYER